MAKAHEQHDSTMELGENQCGGAYHGVHEDVLTQLVSSITDLQDLAVEDQLHQEKERMLEHFIHFYMRAKGAHTSAKVFREEAKLSLQLGALQFNLEEAKKLFDKFSQWRLQIPPQCVLTELFCKNLSKSDVGKSRGCAHLCVPKSLAEEHICPRLADKPPTNLVAKDLDELGKTWSFLFYAKNNSWVMTKGWTRYVKEKGLKEGSKVIFKTNPAGEFFLRCEK